MINSCVLVGRLCAAPEVKPLTNGGHVGNFRLAVNRNRKDSDGKDEADFLDIVCFNKTAEFVGQYVDKGAMVGVEGRIQTRSWSTQDGQKRWAVEIIANRVQTLETRKDAEARRGTSGEPQSAPTPAATPAPRASGSGFSDDKFEDDPFGD